MEAAVEAAMCSWFGAALPPLLAHNTEAEVISGVLDEEALCNQPYWPIHKISRWYQEESGHRRW